MMSSSSGGSDFPTPSPAAASGGNSAAVKKRTWAETFDDLFRARLEPFPVRSRFNAANLAANNLTLYETPGSSGLDNVTPTHSAANSEKTREEVRLPGSSSLHFFPPNQPAMSMSMSQQPVAAPDEIALPGVVTPRANISPARYQLQGQRICSLLTPEGRTSSRCSSSSHGSGGRSQGSEPLRQQPDSMQAPVAAVASGAAAPAPAAAPPAAPGFPRPASMEGLSTLRGVCGARSFLARECMSQPQSREATPVRDERTVEGLCFGMVGTPDCKRARLLAEVKLAVASSPPSVLAAALPCPMLTKAAKDRLRHHRVTMLRGASFNGCADSTLIGRGNGVGKSAAGLETMDDKKWPVLFGVRLIPGEMSA
ncbi:hypothetical protein CLOM_g5134 [Closterium sp. NIES-68]|nr:hypothetical protein CLOM_g5134 [Closterium sp. NIES-68]GJP79622.1 hypothetical protein CLOP_g9831 [Closterium sp. NIES-67]